MIVHVFVHLLAAALILKSRFGQIDGEHTRDSDHPCYASVNELCRKTRRRGGEKIQRNESYISL